MGKTRSEVVRRLRVLIVQWLTVFGLAAMTWGVCLFLFPLGVIFGGLCAVLLDWYTDQAQGGDE